MLTGQSQDELRDQGWLSAVHPEDQGQVVAAWAEALAARRPAAAELPMRASSEE